MPVAGRLALVLVLVGPRVVVLDAVVEAAGVLEVVVGGGSSDPLAPSRETGGPGTTKESRLLLRYILGHDTPW